MSKGGMQTAGLHYAIYCPKCGKPAARKELLPDGSFRYLHFTRKGSVWHMMTPQDYIDTPEDWARRAVVRKCRTTNEQNRAMSVEGGQEHDADR